MTGRVFFHRIAARLIFTAILTTGFAALPALAADKVLIIKGSDTKVNLMSNLAEAYMKVHKDVDISVTGGGSGTGISALV